LWSGSERRDSGSADDDVTLADQANRQRLPPNARVTARFDISPFPIYRVIWQVVIAT
jgi:hypothetical protein